MEDAIKSGKVWTAAEEQKISIQVWRIPLEKINIFFFKGVGGRGLRSIRKRGVFDHPGMGKYIHVQTSREIIGDDLVEKMDNTVKGLILPEIVYNVKKKLGCIFI